MSRGLCLAHEAFLGLRKACQTYNLMLNRNGDEILIKC